MKVMSLAIIIFNIARSEYITRNISIEKKGPRKKNSNLNDITR